MLMAQAAGSLSETLTGANPVLTPVEAAQEMNLWDMAVKGGWIMVVLGVMSLIGFYILFERNYVIRKAGKEDPLFMDKIKDYILGGEIKAAIAYCRSVNTPSAAEALTGRSDSSVMAVSMAAAASAAVMPTDTLT